MRRRGLKDRLLTEAVATRPAIALWLLEWAVRLGAAHPPYTAAELGAAMPQLRGEGLRQALRRATWLDVKLRALGRLRSRLGPDALSPHVRLHDEAGLAARAAAGDPAILLTWHLGAARLLGSGLAPTGLRLLVIRLGPSAQSASGVSYVQTGPQLHRRALALGRALAHLREGGSVLLTADGSGAPTIPVTCLGREIRFSRGAFALARLTGAPVIPVAGLGSGPGADVEIQVQPALASATEAQAHDAEAALAQDAALRLEALLLRHPGELRRPLLDRLRRAPSPPVVLG